METLFAFQTSQPTSWESSRHFAATTGAFFTTCQSRLQRIPKYSRATLFSQQKRRVCVSLCEFIYLFVLFFIYLFIHFLPPPSSPTEVCVVDCGPHGSCISGVCQCEEGWTGPECEQRDCHPRCIDHGVCRDGKCDCHQGWTGEHCTIGEAHTLAETRTRTHRHTHPTRGYKLGREI